MSEWVPIEEDLPQKQAGMNRCSIDIKILLDSGKIKDGFCTLDDEEFYESNGKHISHMSVVGWQTR